MRFQFGEFVLDPDRRELFRGPERILLEPQVFDLLVYLITHRERVVSKDELLDAVWDGRIVSESTLNSRIAAARRAIGDSGEAQHLIRTISRKGLRFVGTVSDDVPPVRLPSPPQPPAPVQAIPRMSLAVLPFSNVSPDPEQEYFADGLVENLTTELSISISGLSVIARGSSGTYKGRTVDVKQIGQELGVSYVLQGSVQRGGDKVRVNARLTDTEAGVQIWAERFDGDRADLFALQDLITARVAATLDVPLVQAESLRAMRERPNNPDATDLVMRGRALMSVVTPENYVAAGKLFEQALTIDPNNARAWSALANVLVNPFLNSWDVARTDQLDAADQALERALAIDPRLAHAQFVKGYVLRARQRHEAALAAFDCAVAINPNYASAILQSGVQRTYLGRPAEALPLMYRAVQLSRRDPSIGTFYANIGLAYFCLEQYPEAILNYEKCVTERPDFMAGFRGLVALYVLTGREAEAREALATLLRRFPNATIATLRSMPTFHPTLTSPVILAWQQRYCDALYRAGMPEG